MTRIVAKLVLSIVLFNVGIIAVAYVGYFTGMVVALTSTTILGVGYDLIPIIFAWLAVVTSSITFSVKLLQDKPREGAYVEMTEEEAKEFELMFGTESDKEDE